MRNLIVMFVTAVCFLFLFKLKWPKNKNFYEPNTSFIYFFWQLTQHTLGKLKLFSRCSGDCQNKQSINFGLERVVFLHFVIKSKILTINQEIVQLYNF